jgi:hypothetical protein
MAITVTAAQGGSTGNGILLRVKVLTGQAASPIGANASKANTAAAALDTSITTTVTGSYVYGAVESAVAGSLTAAAGTTLFDNVNDPTNGEQYGTCRTTSTTGTPGATTVGATTSAIGDVALLEILAGTGLTEDASSPAPASTTATTTITSASFTPPAGSLLVAMVASDGGTGTVTVTVSDSSSLTWTQRANAAGTHTGYAGVWTAPVPPPIIATAAAAGAGSVTAANFGPWTAAASGAGAVTGTTVVGVIPAAPAILPGGSPAGVIPASVTSVPILPGSSPGQPLPNSAGGAVPWPG